MNRSVPIRPVMLASVIGLVLLGGIIFLRSKKPTMLFSPPGEVTIRQQLYKKHKHPLLVWEQGLSLRPSREMKTNLAIDFVIDTSLERPDIPRKIPALSGSVQLTQTLWNTETYGSGSLQIQGEFVVHETKKISPTDVDGPPLTGSEYILPTTISWGATVQFLRSGTTTWWFLEEVSLVQSGNMYEFPIILRAFLQEYAQTWIEQEQTPVRIQDIRLFALYKKLTQQIDQHLITIASGSTQLLINGPERGIDAVLDEQDMLQTQLRFPKSGIRVALEEQAGGYTISLTHYRVPTPLLTGMISFAPTQKILTSTSKRTGSPLEQLEYHGSHNFSIHPVSLFTITPPTQVRNWEEIMNGRKKSIEE